MEPLIVANWKCNPSLAKDAKKIFESVRRNIKGKAGAEIVICPPSVFIPILAELKGKKAGIHLGAQDCFWENRGAFTGCVSPQMLKDLGCKYVILGHSERRHYFGETDENINKKIKLSLSVGLFPILCVGETLEERGEGKTFDVLKFQIENDLKDITVKGIKSLIIAYEPVWAIGTGNPCPPDEAQTMSLTIRKILSNLYSRAVSDKVPILYGGSVNSRNAADYVKEVGMQGLLVGGASLDAREFSAVIESVI